MPIISFLVSALLSATSLTITEPENWAAYNLDLLPGIRVILENENVLPDSVHYSLNGASVVPIPRLNTDWPTYMQNYQNHGFSESPAPMTDEILWTAPVTGTEHEFPTPVVVNGIVYYPSNFGTDSLHALDAATGGLVWKQRVGYTDDAVTVQDGRVYTASDSLFCFESLTGDRVWSSPEADWCGSTPVVTDGRVYGGTGPYSGSQPDTSTVVCLDAEYGSVIWSRTLYNAWLASCMGIVENTLIVPTYKQYEYSSLYAIDALTGDILWENNDAYEGYWDSSPVIVDGMIYINGEDGMCRAIDANNGDTVWERSLTPGVGISATPAYNEGVLYFADQVDSYHCLNSQDGTTIWAVPGYDHGSSAVADGMIFYGDCSNVPQFGSVVALSCSDGSEVWRYDALGTVWIAGSPSVTDGVVYIPMHDGNLYAFGTGLKYTYLDDILNPEIGWNELVATSFDNGAAVASDTVNFYINPTGIEFEPSGRLLLTGSPNPFLMSTELSFSLPAPGFTSVEIYDLTGRCVSNLIENDLVEGIHTVYWQGTDNHGNRVPAGLYICRIESGRIIETTGLCLLR